jgi:isopentenyl diphosphate isomerase/L-lactate dehydrogenase-like FMN-dependent dehydrogenase
MLTLRENRESFARFRLLARVLIDVTNIDTKTTILGEEIATPICIAPTAMQSMAHLDGEVATVKAALRYHYKMLPLSLNCIWLLST